MEKWHKWAKIVFSVCVGQSERLRLWSWHYKPHLVPCFMFRKLRDSRLCQEMLGWLEENTSSVLPWVLSPRGWQDVTPPWVCLFHEIRPAPLRYGALLLCFEGGHSLQEFIWFLLKKFILLAEAPCWGNELYDLIMSSKGKVLLLGCFELLVHNFILFHLCLE